MATAAAQALAALWADGGAQVLADAGVDRWETLLAKTSDDAVATALRSRTPGLALAKAVRHAAEDTARFGPRAAPALTQAMARWLAARVGPGHPETLHEVAQLGRLALDAGRAALAWDRLTEAWSGLATGAGDGARTLRVGVWACVAADLAGIDGAEVAHALRLRATPEAVAEAFATEAVRASRRGREGHAAAALARAIATDPARDARWTTVALTLDAGLPWLAAVRDRLGQHGGTSIALDLAMAVRAPEGTAWRYVQPHLDAACAAPAGQGRLLAVAAQLSERLGDGVRAEGIWRAWAVSGSDRGADALAYARFLARLGEGEEAAVWAMHACRAWGPAIPAAQAAVVAALIGASARRLACTDGEGAAAMLASAKALLAPVLPSDHPAWTSGGSGAVDRDGGAR